MPTLDSHLDVPLPEAVAVGAGTAVFVAGWCTVEDAQIASLAFVVDGAEQAVAAHGMPRLDVLHTLSPSADPYATPDAPGYRSGFWGLVRIGPRTDRGAQFGVVLRARLAGGGIAEAPLGTIGIEDPPVPLASPAEPADDLVAICMATHEPPAELLRRQIDSIRAQTHANWVCVISDDCSGAEAYADLLTAVGDDARFLVSRTPRRLGFFRNFERALALAPAEAHLIALADQDDAWHPGKLKTLIGGLGDALLVYSDARLVDPRGEVLAESYWGVRRNNHRDLRSVLVANSVTGAASLLRRTVLDAALPFPPAQFAHFHDHWLALVALSLGDIAYVDRPLYDYVQHGDAVLGHAAANRITGLRERLSRVRRDPRERVRMWRLHYFVDIARLNQLAAILLYRLGPRMPAGKRRVLERWLRTERSASAVLGLWAAGVRELVGRQETLGAEWTLAHAFSWRRALGATAGRRPVRGLRLDAAPPSDLAPRPGASGPSGAAREVADKIAPLALAVDDAEPARINVLIPTIDLAHLFGGYIGKLNLALRLAERGHRVRVVTVDPVGPLPPSWRGRLEEYEGLSGFSARVEVAFGRAAPGGLPVSPRDRFVATTWWTAHIAAAAGRELGGPPFHYLIQEYEPFTFPMSTWAALAEQSYRFPHTALFSTELLRDYFRRHGIGVYATGAEAGDRASLAFQNAITRVPPPTAEALGGRQSRRLLFYARPEPHAARNLFELGVLALGRAAAAGTLRGWELWGVGTVSLGRHLDLGGGARLALLPRSAQRDYAGMLADHDVGLALMHTPHPSLVPIEMASAGMLTVTSTFETKTAGALAAISPNIIGVAPTVEEVAAALATAVAGVGDVERRVAGSRVAWSSDWARSFDAALIDRVRDLIA